MSLNNKNIFSILFSKITHSGCNNGVSGALTGEGLSIMQAI